MKEIAEYFRTDLDEYIGLLLGHIGISALSVLLAMAVAIPLGVLVYRNTVGRIIAERFFGLLRIVPSLAILLILIPVMGTGVKPSVVALTILAIPPILINTVQGFKSLPEPIVEAATGMGMNTRQTFFKVKLPLAFPLMFAGIRTAVVEVIASATLASYIGAGGLGDIIFTGLALLRYSLLIIGGGSVALLSILTGFILDMLYKRATRYQRPLKIKKEKRRNLL
ncbi:MAG: ABC transporter permease [Clostridia bacterium]|nr:ABC transporter permease [Clostridia bacterium]